MNTYKALDYHLKTFGFWPGDLIGTFLSFCVVHWVFNSFLLDLVVVGPLLLLAFKARKRAPGYLSSLWFFASTPARFSVAAAREAGRK
jgi:hypothetical protein